MNPFERIATAVRRDGKAALVTLLTVDGSAPREAGAWMSVEASGRFSGTIGGGTLEWRALALAQEAMKAGRSTEERRFSLGPELGQCCGGRVSLLIEVFGPEDALAQLADAKAVETVIDGHGLATRRPVEASPGALIERSGPRTILRRFLPQLASVVLCGAGHTGRALAMALAPLPVALTWFDPRPDGFPNFIPSNARAISDGDIGTILEAMPLGTLVYIMTHSHALDLECAAAALKIPAIAHVGVIGSATKRARFLSRLRSAKIPTGRFQCPIGITGISSKHPAVIAASVAADILQRADAVLAHDVTDHSRSLSAIHAK
jgi:xanthine dehydrogenase accessory factor